MDGFTNVDQLKTKEGKKVKSDTFRIYLVKKVKAKAHIAEITWLKIEGEMV